MTVANYEKKFMELSWFATSIIADEWEKCRRIEDKLQEEVHIVVTSVAYTKFGKLIEAALRVE